jgi:hypothetical protein
MSLIASLIGPVSGILDKVIPDSDMKAKLAHEIATMSDTHAQQALLAQLEINKGGWRPFIGWTSGVAFAYHFVLQPLLVFVLTASGVDLPDLPEFDMSTLLTVLGGMLGIGGLRSYEKTKGLTK